uniref:Uncharacterized protein n=1 Tax=Amphilophus citrinellus TaxID=61819 RepID=A0A3Q0T2A6_AMPCI
FVACFQEFKRVNGITATCEYCRNERIIKDVKRISSKDCCFCSDACKTLFCQELEGKWGKHCRSCAYCLSISKTLVTAPGDDGDIEFCSAACYSKHKMLLSHVSRGGGSHSAQPAVEGVSMTCRFLRSVYRPSRRS